MGADLSSVYAEDLTGSESLSTSGVDSESWTAVQVVYDLVLTGAAINTALPILGLVLVSFVLSPFLLASEALINLL